MQIRNIHQAKAHLSELITRALAGEDVLIARAGHPLVRLVPIEQDLKPRQGGQLRGKVWIAEDFDAPDPEIEELFYGAGTL
jgi:prevent-host-death family protein